ncbi:hypothetical protein [Phytohabitans kaempferiae]|uniref:Integral membrane protein n=1 Tax=Phytohabitans kaempferiae TaxID=1620943 RepID=A0ABV6M1M8_9ACTN
MLAVVAGAVWTLQGLGVLTGSVMTDEPLWVVLGVLAVLVGLILVVMGLRTRGRGQTGEGPGPTGGHPTEGR